MKPTFIAEIKTKSPHGYQSPHSFIQLMEAAIEYGDWISVHDNAMWGGDYESISFVRRYTDKPILAKGFHSTEESIQKALDHGANKVLIIGDKFNGYFPSDVILREINGIGPKNLWGVGSNYLEIVINSRDLRTGKIIETSDNIIDFTECGFNVFQASNIKCIDDVHPQAVGFIVGTHLMNFIKNR